MHLSDGLPVLIKFVKSLKSYTCNDMLQRVESCKTVRTKSACLQDTMVQKLWYFRSAVAFGRWSLT